MHRTTNRYKRVPSKRYDQTSTESDPPLISVSEELYEMVALEEGEANA